MEHEALRQLTAAYALHALDPDEERAFEEHLSRCPECREELAEFHDVAALLAHDVEAPAPPPELRERIIELARAERPNVVPLHRRWGFRAAVAAAAAAAGVAIGLAVWAGSLSGQLDEEQEARANEVTLVAILADPGASRVPVSGTEGLLVVAQSRQAALVLDNLPPAPSGKTYQAWVIEEGQPRTAGIFASAGQRTLVILDVQVPAGSVVAVTIEPAGGLDQPTREPEFATEPV